MMAQRKTIFLALQALDRSKLEIKEAASQGNNFNNYQLNSQNKRITKRLERMYDEAGTD